MPYAFKHPFKRAAAAFLDRLSALVCRHARRPRPAALKTIAVIRVDQIGDVAFAEPFLRALKSRVPGARIVFVTTAAGRELIESAGSADELVVFDAPWFRQAGILAGWKGFGTLKHILRNVNADAVIDLRGDLRHILAAACGSPRSWRAGYGVTGGRFLLDAEPAYEPRMHAAERNFRFLDCFGAGPAAPKPEISARLASAPLPAELAALLPAKVRPWVALHAGAGTQSKEWPDPHWVRLARALAQWDAEIFWIGDAAAQIKTRRILTGVADIRARFTDLTNRIPLGALGTFFDKCEFLVSGDSGPVHVAASRRLKTMVLFSGANEIFEWKPLSSESDLVYHEVPCSPCHERVCPKARHFCMEDLEPQTAIDEANRLIREKKRRVS